MSGVSAVLSLRYLCEEALVQWQFHSGAVGEDYRVYGHPDPADIAALDSDLARTMIGEVKL